MKFLYEYRTRENELKEGVIASSDREAAFAALKAQGIRPARLTEAPGIFNKIFGKGKRWMAISVLSVALVSALVVLGLRTDAPNLEAVEYSPAYLELEREARSILPTATNDFTAARERLRQIFLERLDELGRGQSERDAARTLYGEIALRLDLMESSLKRGKRPRRDDAK